MYRTVVYIDWIHLPYYFIPCLDGLRDIFLPFLNENLYTDLFDWLFVVYNFVVNVLAFCLLFLYLLFFIFVLLVGF